MLTTEHLAWALAQWFTAREPLCDRLNAADAKLGDGDTGMTIKLIIESLQNTLPTLSDDVGTALKACAQECARASGSSLGTVIAMGLSRAASVAQGQQHISPQQLAAMLAAAIERITERSGSALGDKTILDSLDQIRRNLAQLSDPTPLLISAFAAANEALHMFRQRPCQVGRARIYADKTIGVDDPGMLAVFLLLQTLCDAAAANQL